MTVRSPSLAAIKVFFVGLAGSLALRLIACTLRWRVVGLDGKEREWSTGDPRILTFWHGQQLMMPWVYLRVVSARQRRPLIALISQHNDGRMVARVMRFLGIGSIAGSSSRGGREAMFAMIERLREGSHVAITPDGPKGPVNEVKGGVIRIAQRSQAPILPAAFDAARKWTFRSWDGMVLPRPFSKAVLVVGDTIAVPSELANGDAEQYALTLRDTLNSLTRRAGELVA